MKYDTGTVAVTNGSATVVGTGTVWSTSLAAGQLFSILGSGVTYTIASITNDTHLVLSANYGGTTASGQLYTVMQGFTTNYSIPYPDIGDVQTATLLKAALVLIDSLILPATATTTSLTSAANTINTKNKKQGRRVWNTTTHKSVTANGANATDVWYDESGSVAHTPV